tara:strand:- start:141 stop:299 length:159 start_codon:yes stop_codon:yes gene_type:complete
MIIIVVGLMILILEKILKLFNQMTIVNGLLLELVILGYQQQENLANHSEEML